MEKLTIEEKAKCYDEAIKIAKSKIKNDKDHVLYEKDIVDIFHELKESNNENIRKSLIGFLKECRNNTRSEVMLDEYARWIAWLEKQDEQKYTKNEEFECPSILVNDAIEVTSRMKLIDDDLKLIAEFILEYANWDLNKDEWNQPTITVPVFRVLDALINRGQHYCGC